MIAGLPEEEFFASGHTACAGCGLALAIRYALKAAGKNVIVIEATGCGEVFSTPYPRTSWRVPWIHVAFETAASVASGIERALKIQGKDTKVLVFGGDGATFDIGFGALSGAIERGHDFCYVCFDNGAYMNTGYQRSGATPRFASTTTSPAGSKIHGKVETKKPLPLIVGAHGAYTATATVANPIDVVNKVKKGLAKKGPAYVQVFCPCIPGWKMDSHKTIEISRLAVNSLAYPIYEIEDGVITINQKPEKPVPIRDYMKLQKRFAHLNDEEIAKVQDFVNSEYQKLLKLEESKIKI